MTFPNTALDIRVQIFLLGEWVDMGPVFAFADDFYTEEYTLEYIGRLIRDGRRLPDQEISISRGRADEASDSDPGSVSLFLWNEDGYLTPGNPLSPWYAEDGTGWGLNTQLRILVGDSVRFHGEVSEIVPDWPQGDLSDELTDEELADLGSVDIHRLGFAVVNITASGILRRLGQRTKPLRSALQRLVTSPTNLPHVVDYWPMEDGKDSGFFATGLPANAGGQPKLLSDGWSLASDDSLWGSQSLPTVSSGGNASAFANLSARTSILGTEWTVEWVVRIPEAPTVSECLRVEVATTGSIVRWAVSVGYEVTPYVLIQGFDADGDELVHSADRDVQYLFGGHWSNVRFKISQDGSAIRWAIVWSPITPDADPQDGGGSIIGGTIGVPTTGRLSVPVGPPQGIGVGHFILHEQPGGWLVPADIGWLGERSATRFRKIATEENIPWRRVFGPSGCGLEGPETTRQMGTQESLPALDLLSEAAATDNGVMVEERDALGVVLITRGARYNRPVSFELDARDKSQIAIPFAPITDDQTRANDVTASRIDGTEYRMFDPDAVEVYDQALSFSMLEDNAVKHYAGWWFHLGTDESPRHPQVTIDLAVCGDTLTTGGVTLIEAWKAADPLQARFTVTNLPPQHPTWPLVDSIIEGYTETLSAFGWTVGLNCSPAAPWQVAVWGETRYTTTAVLASGIDADDTSLSVTSTTPWDDAETPFDLEIGSALTPEVVTVTNISGVGTTQTFTVTRGVHGYQRAHASGAPVVTADAEVLAL